MNKFPEYYNRHDLKINFGISILLILLLFQIKFGLEILVPTNIGWLMRWDLAGYVIVLDIFRSEPWGFPLGQVNGYYYPVGANVGEILPIVVKLLSPILPRTFQYIGLFLIMGHILLSLYTLKLFKLFNITGVIQLLATLFIVINPVLLYRFIHPSLTAQWLLVASLWLYFVSSTKYDPAKVMVYQATLFVLSGLIFPYLAVMIAVFLFALGFKLWVADHLIGFRKFSLYILTSFTVLLTCWYIIGLISFSNSVDMDVPNAYGLYGWNLNSFYNAYDLDGNGYYQSNNLSSFMPAFPHVTWHQYEGFSYLGLGMIILLLLAIRLYAYGRRPALDESKFERKTNIIPLAFFTLLVTLFAISNTVTFNDQVLFKIPIPALAQKFGDIFRASGRFIWIAYYSIIIAVLFFISKTMRSRTAITSLLAVTLVIQVWDMKPMISNKHFSFEPYHTPLTDQHWENLIQQFDYVMFYPPFLTSNLSHDDYRYFTYLAGKNQKKINTGYLGRIDFTAANKFSGQMQEELREPLIHDRWLYITTRSKVSELFKAFFDGQITILMLDEYVVFFSSSRLKEVSGTVNQIRQSNDQTSLTNQFELQTLTPVQPKQTKSPWVKMNMYEVTVTKQFGLIKGWAFIEGSDQIEADSVTVLFKYGSSIWSAPAKRFETPDVVDFFHDDKYRYSGFSTTIHVENFARKELQIGISIDNKKTSSHAVQWTNAFASFEEENAKPRILEDVPMANENVKFIFDVIEERASELEIQGWAFVEPLRRSNAMKPEVILFSDSGTFQFTATQTIREDVAKHYNDLSLQNAGFRTKISKSDLPRGAYHIGVLLTDTLSNRCYFQRSNDVIYAGYPVFPKPEVLEKILHNTDSVRGTVDRIEEKEKFVLVEGWAFINELSTDFSESWIVLQSQEKMFSMEVIPRNREDVQKYFGLPYPINMSGFSVKIKKESLQEGTYRVCILMLNKKNNKKSILYTDRNIKI